MVRNINSFKLSKAATVGVFILMGGLAAGGEADSIREEAAQVATFDLTYWWAGWACPTFVDTKEQYGFSIKCTGCGVSAIHIRHNRRVERRINKVYGKDWFQNNLATFYQG